jgi:predicted glycosyltransferase involved in capsule biosynthesis
MIPTNVDYSYSDVPLHMATNFLYFNEDEKPKETFEEYFGGVTMFPSSIFEAINGYSNEYWGWGYEDDDLLFRCKSSPI